MESEGRLMSMLTGYAAAHQHPFNIVVHMIGIPTIMLGVLIGSYAFAMQPDAYRASKFARRLVDRLMPPMRVLRRARIEVETMLEQQRTKCGIDTRVSLPW